MARLLAASGIALAFLLMPGAARAYEDQWSLGVELGYAHATERGLPHEGAAVGLEASLGLNQALSLRGAVAYSLHPGSHNLSVLDVSGELIYLFDVLEVVPYFGAGVDGVGSWIGSGRQLRASFGLHPVVGLDWLFSRDMSFGVEAKPVFLVSAWDRAPLYLTVLLNATLLFDL